MTAIPLNAPNIPILGQNTPINGNLSFVAVDTSVNEKLMPVVSVTAEGTYEGRPVALTGELTLTELRDLAITWLQAAIGAHHDAAVAQQLVVGAKAEPAQAVAFVEALNARRRPPAAKEPSEGP